MQESDAMAASMATLNDVETSLLSTRCRYKTGRCPNQRAVKANGTLLLLCESHRHQQNRTKKRSDIKCRHDRAKKRQNQREKLHTKQLPVISSQEELRRALSWSPITLPLTSIVTPFIDEHELFRTTSVSDSEKVVESTSPTAVDLEVSSVNWHSRRTSYDATLATRWQDTNAFAPEDIWLLEYFIL